MRWWPGPASLPVAGPRPTGWSSCSSPPRAAAALVPYWAKNLRGQRRGVILYDASELEVLREQGMRMRPYGL